MRGQHGGAGGGGEFGREVGVGDMWHLPVLLSTGEHPLLSELPKEVSRYIFRGNDDN